MASKLRRFLDKQGVGSTQRLAAAVGRSRTYISRVADWQRGLPLEIALKISEATGIAVKDLAPPARHTTKKTKRKTNSQGRA